MKFKRKKKRGVNKKVRRIWLSKEGYRIVWRKEVFGVSVPARFQACVRTLVAGNFEGGYRESWDFVNPKHRLYKSIKAAIADCERHVRRWCHVIHCTRIRDVREMFGGRPPHAIPVWASKLMDQRIQEIMLDTQPRRRHRDEDEMSVSVTKPEEPEKKQRRTRSDKGKKRGPRKQKGSVQ